MALQWEAKNETLGRIKTCICLLRKEMAENEIAVASKNDAVIQVGLLKGMMRGFLSTCHYIYIILYFYYSIYETWVYSNRLGSFLSLALYTIYTLWVW